MASDRTVFDPDDADVNAYKLLTALVVPRPIAWVSTVDAAGRGNLAPHSFFTVASGRPPVVLFSSLGRKDTVRNIEETKEFVWNLVTMPLAQQMNVTSAHVPPDVSEFTTSGLTPVPSRFVKVPRVGETSAAMELSLIHI